MQGVVGFYDARDLTACIGTCSWAPRAGFIGPLTGTATISGDGWVMIPRFSSTGNTGIVGDQPYTAVVAFKDTDEYPDNPVRSLTYLGGGGPQGYRLQFASNLLLGHSGSLSDTSVYYNRLQSSHLWASTYLGGQNTTQYWNGAEYALKVGGPVWNTVPGPLQVGAVNGQAFFENFRGGIKFVLIMNRALTQSEVAAVARWSWESHGVGPQTSSSNSQFCVNTQGSFSCNCSSGFTRVGGQCIDIDECTAGTPCGSSRDCINTIGSFTCACKPGYGNVGCVDINECGSAIFPCPFKSFCTNTIGSFTCACPSGTLLSGSACVDVDECATGTHDCNGRSCVNKFGSYDCVCTNCSSVVRGVITSVFTGLRVVSAEVYVLSHTSNELVASAFTVPADNGTFAVTVPMSSSVGIPYRLLVKSFHNAELYFPFTVSANQEVIYINVSVFQYCESLLGASASAEYSGCIDLDPNMFTAIPSSVPINKPIALFGAEFPLMLCEARLGINISSDPDTYFVAQTCSVTSTMTALVLANNATDAFVPLQIQLLFRASTDANVSRVLATSVGIVTLLNGTSVMQAVSPSTG